MTDRWLRLFDGHGPRPSVVVWSAVLGVLAGGMTLIVSVIVVLPVVAAGWSVAWLVVVDQVAAGVLMVVGGVRLAMGLGRVELVIGAVLELVACAVYLTYTVTVVAPDPIEPVATSVVMITVALVFATLATAAWLGATRPAATEYLRFSG